MGYDLIVNNKLASNGLTEYQDNIDISEGEYIRGNTCEYQYRMRSGYVRLTYKPPVSQAPILLFDASENWYADTAGTGYGTHTGYTDYRDIDHVKGNNHPGAVFSDKVMVQVYFDQVSTSLSTYTYGSVEGNPMGNTECTRQLPNVTAACKYYNKGTANHNPGSQLRRPKLEDAISDMIKYGTKEEGLENEKCLVLDDGYYNLSDGSPDPNFKYGFSVKIYKHKNVLP